MFALEEYTMNPHYKTIHAKYMGSLGFIGGINKKECWPNTSHTITAGDVDGWCQN